MTLKEWMKIQNITTKQFAKKIEVSRSQVHKYMHEGAIPSLQTMQKIFEVTEKTVTPNDFYSIALEITKPNAEELTIQFEGYKNVKD